ncbi:M23 family metallopeptidase [Planctobacterium marinum]|uniref:M23 family metallopeptidase n=1 Tax=Planctobacterium marinum TaxID=1631968 RepID=UPI001E545066|nr:M23 family metallopeptidase [Planctobacterium marinum]MCC2605395.1 M23 family metallopeptidase [Planctobacterium marinum]
MSLTILYRSRRIKLIKTVSLNRLALGGVLGGLLLTAILVSENEPELNFSARVAVTQTGLIEQQHELHQLRQSTEQKLTGMLLKLGEMQSELQRLNALGERLAVESDLHVDEFQFGQPMPIGGPSHDVEMPSVDSSLDVLHQIDAMMAQLQNKSQQLQALESVLMQHHIQNESFISGRPIESGWLSSYYGMRKDPFSGLPAMHKGIDFAGSEGAPVVVTGAGMVVWSGPRYGYGNLVEVDHGDGLVTRYGHNKKIHVKIGDVVTKGQKIADMGQTGRATGAHVHYEVLRNGNQMDPLQFVYRKAVN